MTRRLRHAAWVLAAALLAAAAGAESGGAWRPGGKTEGDGYAFQVFSREDAAGLVVYQARGRIEAAPDVLVDAVWAVMSDPESAPEGQTRRVVERGESGFVVYTHIDLPALFSDRDIVTRGASVAAATPGGRRIDWEAIAHDAAPPVDGAIRIERSAGFWDFAPDGPGSLLVYETYVDLGGSLPDWIVQPLMGGMIGDTVEDVARRALEP